MKLLKNVKILCYFLFIIFLFTGCSTNKNITQNLSTDLSSPSKSDSFSIHFIDVGQGDSILIQSGSESMLIDAGENEYGETVVEYLKTNHIKNLKYVIGTHPHSDHIGGLDNVILNFSIEKLFLSDKIEPTKTFEDVLTAIENKKLSITLPKIGNTYSLGESNFTIISPKDTNTSNSNNSSIGIHLTYGNTSFLLCGDAEKEAENLMLENKIDLSSTVLKCSHHGSNTASSNEFLDAVNPKFAIISVGKNNSYGHPHQEVLTNLQNRNCKILRTDELGTIVLKSNGKEITNIPTINQIEISTLETSDLNLTNAFYYTKTGTKYHKKNCNSLKNSKAIFEGSLEEMKEKGLNACKICKP